jgi:NADH-ubiquinone oxidoreductase chain 2
MPKISIILLLLELEMGISLNISQPLIAESSGSLSSIVDSYLAVTIINEGQSNDYFGVDQSPSELLKNMFLLSSLLSLIIGTVVGLAQIRIKRLLAYSTVSHIGFLLLALAISTEQSIESLIFYLIQYTITNLNAFFILLAFGYIINSLISLTYINSDIKFIFNLKGQFFSNPILSLSLVICLFSMAGIPPLIGFFGKQSVLLSAIGSGYFFMAILAIVVSVISASYYLRIIRELHSEKNTFSDKFDESDKFDKSPWLHGARDKSSIRNLENQNRRIESLSTFFYSKHSGTSTFELELENNCLNLGPALQSATNYTYLKLTNIHAFIIAFLTLSIIFYVLKPSILLNSAVLSTLSLFYF